MLLKTRPAGVELNVPPKADTLGVGLLPPMQYVDCPYVKTLDVGAFTVIVCEDVAVQTPLSVYVTVYVPGKEADKFITPVEVLLNIRPAGDALKIPPAVVMVGFGFGEVVQYDPDE